MCPWRVKIKQPLQKSRKLSLIYRTLPNQTVTEVRSKFWSWSFVKILKLNFSQEVDAEQNNKVTIEICSSSNPKNSARWRVPELPLIILCWVVFAVAMLLLHLLSLTVKRPFLNTPLSIQGSDCNECLQIHICKLIEEKITMYLYLSSEYLEYSSGACLPVIFFPRPIKASFEPLVIDFRDQK